MQNEFISHENNSGDNAVSRYEDMLFHQQIGYFDVEEFERIIEYYLINLKTRKAMEVVEEGLKQHPGSVTLFYFKARVLHKMGKYNLALGVLNGLGTAFVEEEVLILKGEIYLKLEKFSAAEDAFSRLIKFSDEETDRICMDIAYLYMGVQQTGMALKYMKKGLEYNPDNGDILFELAMYCEENGNSESAIEYLNRLLDGNSYNEEAWHSLGMSYYNLENYEKALEAFDFALTIDPGYYNAMLQKGITHLKMDDYEEALKSFKRFLNPHTQNEELLLYLAECYEGMGDFIMAEQTYRTILDSEPDVYDAWLGLAYCKQSGREYESSIEYFNKAIALNDEDEEAWSGLGESYFYLGKKKEAEQALSHSLKIDPEQEDVWIMLIAIRIEINEIAQAKSALNMSLSIISDSEGLRDLQKILSILDDQPDPEVGNPENLNDTYTLEKIVLVSLKDIIETRFLKN